MNEHMQAKVVSEALTWLNTPYHHQANIKGVGVDCIMLLVEVYKACGLIAGDVDPRPYTADWHFHQSDEVYLNGILRYARKVDMPEPGDIALFQFGRCVSHGGIVTESTTIIHAYQENRAVVLTDISMSAALAKRLRGYYRLEG